MTVKLLADYPYCGSAYKAGNLLTADAGTEAGLVAEKLAVTDLTGGTAYVAPVVQPQYTPVTSTTNPLTGRLTNSAGESDIDLVNGEVKNNALPFIVAHRGFGALVSVDNAMSAYQDAAACGLMNIELDVQTLADGTLACMHDTTVDRTASQTGSVTALTSAQFKALTLDPATYLGGSYPPESPPLFSEALAYLLRNTNAVLWPEVKTGLTSSAMVAALSRVMTPTNRVVVQSFTLSDAPAVTLAGYSFAYGCDATAVVNWASLASQGVSYVYSNPWTLAASNAAKAVGITPVAYTPNRRWEYAALKAMGVEYSFSDDPLWISGAWQPKKRDMFVSGKWLPGMLSAISNRGEFLSGGYFGWSEVAGVQFCLQGWACPINNDDNANTFTIGGVVNIVADGGDASRHADIFVCANTDRAFTDAGVAGLVGGYNLLLRKDGRLQVYKIAPLTNTELLATTTGAAVTLGADYGFSVQVTPSTITFTVTGVGSVSVTDTSFRGGYFHLGKSNASVKYRYISIS